jgi:hypothetical protein
MLASATRTAKHGENEPGERVVTRHGRSIHMVCSKQSRPTGEPAPIRMATALSRANALPITKKLLPITLANTNFGPPGLTNAAAIGGPPEDPIHKTP